MTNGPIDLSPRPPTPGELADTLEAIAARLRAIPEQDSTSVFASIWVHAGSPAFASIWVHAGSPAKVDAIAAKWDITAEWTSDRTQYRALTGDGLQAVYVARQQQESPVAA